MTTTRHLRHDAIPHDFDGIPAVNVGPIAPDHAPDPIKEGLARRRTVNLGGTCPCGASPPRLSRQQRRKLQRDQAKGHAPMLRLQVHHEPDCPALNDHLVPALQAWMEAAT